MSVPEMTERFKINPRTLNPALRALVHVGILNSRTGGSDRGYVLARHPKDISIYEIVQTIQGEPRVECCMDSVGCENCDVSRSENGRCQVFNKLNSVMDITRSVIGELSLFEQFYNSK